MLCVKKRDGGNNEILEGLYIGSNVVDGGDTNSSY